MTDVDSPAARPITSLTIATGNGAWSTTGTAGWTYTPAANDDSAVTFNYTASDGTLSASTRRPRSTSRRSTTRRLRPGDSGAIAEDSGARVITAAELLAGVTDIDGRGG